MSDVIVVGGGLAGIAAAVTCADAGRSVTLVEAKPRLGGLTYSFRRGDLEVDNGVHVFLRCCTAYRALLDRLGVADQTALQERLDIPVMSTWDGRWTRLRRSALPAPWHMGSALLRYRPLHPLARLRAARTALALRGVDRTDPRTDRQSFGDWLRAHGQDARAVEALWDLVGVATLNARADDASLALAAMVFQVGLLGAAAGPDGGGQGASAADIGWSRVPLGRLHGEAAHTRLAAAGVTVRTGVRVTGLTPLDRGFAVSAGSAPLTADQVIVAVPPAAAEALLPPAAVGADGGWANRLGHAPIVNVHIVLSQRVLSEPFVAVVGSPVQWVFDRTEAAGLAHGQYLALSISAADAYVDEPVARLRERFLPQLARILPAVGRAEVLDFFVTRERAATFRPAPGQAVLRPGAGTRMAGLFLAGAWTDTGWPATMEGAVRSGVTAARAALGDPAAASRPPGRGVLV